MVPPGEIFHTWSCERAAGCGVCYTACRGYKGVERVFKDPAFNSAPQEAMQQEQEQKAIQEKEQHLNQQQEPQPSTSSRVVRKATQKDKGKESSFAKRTRQGLRQKMKTACPSKPRGKTNCLSRLTIMTRQSSRNNILSEAQPEEPMEQQNPEQSKDKSKAHGSTAYEKKDMEDWTVEEVVDYTRTLPMYAHLAPKFKLLQVDGKSLLVMKEYSLVQLCSMKMGPALKIVDFVHQTNTSRLRLAAIRRYFPNR